MVYVRKLWILPFLCGIITILSLLTPSAQYSHTFEGINTIVLLWMWGLFYYEIKISFLGVHDSRFEFIYNDPGIFVVGLVISIIFLSSGIINIISSNWIRKASRDFDSIKRFWKFTGAFQIVSIVIYFVATELIFRIFTLSTLGRWVSYWKYLIPSFGIIIPLICGALCLLGVFIGDRYSKKEELPSPFDTIIKNELSFLTPKYANYQLFQKIEPSYCNFCPICGYKILHKGKNFCTNCGIALKVKEKQ